MAVPVVKSIVARLEPYVRGIDAASMEGGLWSDACIKSR